MKSYKQSLKKRTSNKTKKSRSSTLVLKQYTQQRIVTMFLQMLNTVKLYHWKTTSYSQHKATDELYSNLNENIDSFVEIMLGKKGDRVNLTGQKSLPLLDYTNLSDFKKEVEKYKTFLINMNKDAGLNLTNNSDLLNVRDEILGNLNQFTYLLTFK
jgi:DNA-binding ferritin-like protein